MLKHRRVLLAAESLRLTGSGIGRVARLMAKLLAERARGDTFHATALALNDTAPADDLCLPVRTASGSRLRFLIDVHASALRGTHFLYDFGGMGRAHPRYWPRGMRPYLTWIHGIEVWERGRADHARVARNANMLVVNTQYTRERAASAFRGLSRARVCWLSTETDDEPDHSHSFDQPPTVLILARIDAGGGYKGHRELIDAWPSVVSAVPDARLVIAGSGRGLSIIDELCRHSPVRSHIDLRGFVPQAEIDVLWRQASVFSMPSRGEGFGLAYVEAMRHGLPVVASVHDAAPEVNVDGTTGYNVDLRRPSELTDRLVQLLRDRDHAQALGQAGKERWRTHFTLSAFRTRFSPILDELLTQ